MKTDKQLFKIFSAAPEWLFELTRLESPGACKMESLNLKDVEQRVDGVIVPNDVNEPLTVVEFQFYDDETIYARTAHEMSGLQLSQNMRGVQGVILFRYASQDPQTPPWNEIIHTYLLRDLIREFEQGHPQHPLVIVFQPVLLSNVDTLELRAREYYRTIKNSDLDDSTKTTLLEVFVSWIEQRLKHKGKKEIEKMFAEELPDLEETQSGKDLIQIGVERGKTEGKKEGEVEVRQKVLLRQLEQKTKTKVDKSIKQRIQQIESTRKLDSLLAQVLNIKSVDDLKW